MVWDIYIISYTNVNFLVVINNDFAVVGTGATIGICKFKLITTRKYICEWCDFNKNRGGSMATIGELFVNLKADTSNFEKGMDEASSKSERFANSFKGKVGETLQNVGKKMTAAGVGIITSMAGIVKAGSDWSAQVEGQKFLFNNLDKAIQNTINTNSKNATSIGLTNQQYKNGATDIATYYKNMGLTSEETSKLSGKTMELVADLGAVRDVPFDDALSDFKSALMGKDVAPSYRNVA